MSASQPQPHPTHELSFQFREEGRLGEWKRKAEGVEGDTGERDGGKGGQGKGERG